MISRDASRHLTVGWRWLPVPALPVDQRLPLTNFRDDAAFRSVDHPESLRPAFRFSFPQLAQATPDLHFYGLIQIFNTPLFSMTSREAGRSSFAYWGGTSPCFIGEQRFAHFWFFEDQVDPDLVALEFGFDGGFVLHSRNKSATELAARHAEIVKRLAQARGHAPNSAPKP